MFKHHGDTRTHEHNLKIATLLSFVAGSVNVVGFLSVHQLTTNITGHFAFFVDDVFNLKFRESVIFLLYVFAFFLGSVVSNTLVEIVNKRSERNIFILPVALEISILVVVGVAGPFFFIQHPNVVALTLLFAMGLQNSLVTKISNAVVRTTHLTGLVTDLGIEVSQLFFYKTPEQQKKLLSNIQLRASIISFFFIGGVTAGLMYARLQLFSLLAPAALLTIVLVYDSYKFTILRWARKSYQGKHQ